MTVIADAKKRVLLPDARPGDVFAFENQGNGHFLLVRLEMPASPRKKTRAEVLRAIKSSKMKPLMSWEKLRAITREP